MMIPYGKSKVKQIQEKMKSGLKNFGSGETH